jgi:sugar phosphate isomerase/epimerase
MSKWTGSDRRAFLKKGLVGSTALTAIMTEPLLAELTKPQKDPCHGLKLGLTSYTLRKFSLDQGIAMAKAAGVKYISLKDMHLPFNSTTAEREEAHRKIEEAGLTLLGGGVIYMKNDETEVRKYFEYAKDAGMPTIICSPEPNALDLVESMVKQYNIRIAIHNHGPGDKRYPSPLDVLQLVNQRDQRLGICMDVGHTVRIGQDPVEVIQRCSKRLYDFHIKDVTEAKAEGKAIEVGRGVIDIVGVLRQLVQIPYQYHLALEYEANEAAPMSGMCESLGYIRGVLAVI